VRIEHGLAPTRIGKYMLVAEAIGEEELGRREGPIVLSEAENLQRIGVRAHHMSCWRCTTPLGKPVDPESRARSTRRLGGGGRLERGSRAGEPGLEAICEPLALPTTTTCLRESPGRGWARLGEERLGDDRDLARLSFRKYR